MWQVKLTFVGEKYSETRNVKKLLLIKISPKIQMIANRTVTLIRELIGRQINMKRSYAMATIVNDDT